MSKERLFYVEKNDSWHSYEFLEQRQNDPKWRQAFLEADTLLDQEDKKRKRRNFIVLLVSVPLLLIAGMVGLYFYGSTNEVAIPKRQLNLNESTSVSTEATEVSQTMDTTSVGQVLTTPWGEQVTVLRILPNGERVIKETPSPSDLNKDGVLTFEELSQVEEEANRANNQTYQQQPHQGQDFQSPQEQSSQQGQEALHEGTQQTTPQQEQQQEVLPNQSPSPSDQNDPPNSTQQNTPQN